MPQVHLNLCQLPEFVQIEFVEYLDQKDRTSHWEISPRCGYAEVWHAHCSYAAIIIIAALSSTSCWATPYLHLPQSLKHEITYHSSMTRVTPTDFP